MHRLIFGHSFAELVALILLPGLAFYFLNKKKAGARRNAEDVDPGVSGSTTVPTETNSGGSSSSPTETNNGAPSPSPTETNSGASSSSPTDTNSGTSSSSPTKINSSGSSLSPTETNSSESSSSPTDTNNGASSSLTVWSGNRYQVFLSFRGPDTRTGFTDHLYNGLVDAGIVAFRDDDELPEGEKIRPELLAAITNSKILIPILSMNYGTSSWCLDELVQIMECKSNNGQIVLPIFYKVKPSHVGRQIGSFGNAFHEREGRLLERPSFDPTTLEKWKQALFEVSTLKGYEADGYEGKLVKSVVQKVLSELKKEFELATPENLVGIDGHVEKIMKYVDNNSSATLFIGIHGMGGIGKTTLAKIIYNKLSDQFKDRSFIADFRELCQRNGLVYLQNQLIFDILKQEKQVSNKDGGTKFISSQFKDKKVLILLDDVDDHDHLKALAGNHNWFSSGSRILITTRNSSILDSVGADYKYEHEGLDKNHSMVLFSRHAFRSRSPPSEFEDLTHHVIATTGGLPLSLEVLGSLLCGKNREFWKGTIDKSKRSPPNKVQEKLSISYEALDDGQKQIFLDIACFFIGTDKRIAFYMWDACDFFPGEGIEVLRFMSLIKVGDDHKLKMHDHLRDLGREIVRKENQQPEYRSRLWDSEEALKVLTKNKGTEKIEGLTLSKDSFDKTATRDGDIYTKKQFKNLRRLRFLHLERAHLSGDFKDSMEELRWLQWPNCPRKFEVSNFHATELAVLELRRSKMNDQWKGWSYFMMAKKLKYLDLSCCESLENTDFLSAFKNLEVLILNCCKRLKQIDSSIGDMKALLRLELCWCKSLRVLPAEIGKLKALEQLLLRDNPDLSALPDSIGSLQNLEILDISCSGIEELPNGIGRLRKLRKLDASSCKKLGGETPESMCNLSSLQYLDFYNCSVLQSLPDLPSSLTYLGVTCQSRKLPSLSHLLHLEELKLFDCNHLECIQELPSTLLKNSKCSQLTDVERSDLPFLYVFDCASVVTLDVSQFIHLKNLCASFCKKIVEVRGLDKLKYLESLTVYLCISIKRLDLPKFESLKILNVSYCEHLVEIPGLDRLEFLQMLDISYCTSIERLLLPKSRSLKELRAEWCKKLAEIQGLDSLEFLERLCIEGCTSIERLDLSKSGSLKILNVSRCEQFVEIPGLDRLEFLQILDISDCTSIERLDLRKSGSLKILKATRCENLGEIQGLDRLEFLEELNINGCKSLKTIPELSGTRVYHYIY